MVSYENCLQFDAGITTTLSLWCDECRRPRRGAPGAEGELFKKTHCPQCLGEALRRGSFALRKIFMVRE
jgi:hypothetical protein